MEKSESCCGEPGHVVLTFLELVCRRIMEDLGAVTREILEYCSHSLIGHSGSRPEKSDCQ